MLSRCRLLLVVLSMCQLTLLTAQTECTCATDLQALYAYAQKTPAYKQLTKEQEVAFAKQANELIAAATDVAPTYDCIVRLHQLLLPLNDNHNYIVGPQPSVGKEDLRDSLSLYTYQQTSTYQLLPNYQHQLDSLRTVVDGSLPTEVAGWYYRPGVGTLGVVHDPEQTLYRAYLFTSDLPLWQPGDLLYTLLPFGKGYLRSITGSFSNRRLVSYVERIENGRFQTMQFQRDTAQASYSQSLYPERTYVREELSDHVTYLKIGSFSGFNPTLREADQFYATLEGTLTKPHLIVDLRDNGGGGDRNSGQLFKLLKKYVRTHRIYLLVNHRTTSNAEQFAHRLGAFAQCTIVGERTNGTLAYELTGDNYTLPCSGFTAVLTGKLHKEYLSLESQGVEPDIRLDPTASWLSQVLQLIENE